MTFISRLIAWWHALGEGARFCPACGQEVGVDAVTVYHARTGLLVGFRWGGACPKSHASFEVGQRPTMTGNGYLFEHAHWYDFGRPSWLPADVAAFIEAQADDYGSCSTTLTAWAERMAAAA